MTLNELKKQFTDIAERYDSKDYLSLRVKKTLGYGTYAHINNSTSGTINSFYVDNAQNIVSTIDTEVDYEVKGLMIKARDYMVDNGFNEVEINFVYRNINVMHYKLQPVYVEEE